MSGYASEIKAVEWILNPNGERISINWGDFEVLMKTKHTNTRLQILDDIFNESDEYSECSEYEETEDYKGWYDDDLF